MLMLWPSVGPKRWLKTKMRARPKVAASVLSVFGMNQSIASKMRIRPSLVSSAATLWPKSLREIYDVRGLGRAARVVGERQRQHRFAADRVSETFRQMLEA